MLSLSALGEGANYAPFQKTDTEQFVEAVGTLIADPAKPQVATSPSTELGTVYGLASHYFEEHRQFWDKLELVVAFDRTDPRHAITLSPCVSWPPNWPTGGPPSSSPRWTGTSSRSSSRSGFA